MLLTYHQQKQFTSTTRASAYTCVNKVGYLNTALLLNNTSFIVANLCRNSTNIANYRRIIERKSKLIDKEKHMQGRTAHNIAGIVIGN